MKDSQPFGAILKQRRKAIDLTQAQLADQVGCAPSMIRKIELGTRRPSRQLAELLADHLGVEASEREGFLQSARSPCKHIPNAPEKGPKLQPRLVASDLPVYLTPILGREKELTELVALFSEPAIVRLLTISGPAGVGKTRLAGTVVLQKISSGVKS